jgi:hypothetical protein
MIRALTNYANWAKNPTRVIASRGFNYQARKHCLEVWVIIIIIKKFKDFFQKNVAAL